MITLAFYRGEGRLGDRAIRFATRSEFSHVEMIDHPAPAEGEWLGPIQSWSSSGRDGGVRGKEIRFDPDRWVFVEIPWAPESALELVKAHAKARRKYDYLGIVMSQTFNFGRHSENRWFCSEICAKGLGLQNPQTFSPGALYQIVMFLNVVFALGKISAIQEKRIGL